VNFVVDAQLPAKLSRLLAEAGHDSVHTSQLPEGNRVSDATLADLADNEDRVLSPKTGTFATATCCVDPLDASSPSRPATSPIRCCLPCSLKISALSWRLFPKPITSNSVPVV